MKSIKSYLAQADEETTKLFQAHVDAELLERVMEQRTKDGISWRILVEACFKRYLDESKEEA